MRNIFKSRKRKHRILKIRYLLLLVVAYFAYDMTFTYLTKKKFNIGNETFLKMALADTNHNFLYDYQPKKLINQAVSLLSDIDMSNPSSLLKINFFGYKTTPTVAEEITYSDDYDPDAQEKITQYIKDPNPSTVANPKIYIYNSHQLEDYSNASLEVYGITPNVMMVSYLLKEKLNSLGIPTVVGESNLVEFMRVNNWGRAYSYKASRIFMLDAKSKYDTLEYYIDIHRDSIKKAQSTITIKKKSYAKTLFVIGLENPNYDSNLSLAEALHKKINEKYPGLSRGIVKKSGAGVDGVYNQDMSPKAMLIEVGGVDNTIEEVINTTEAISRALYEYIGGAS